jgi:hypothetical protein
VYCQASNPLKTAAIGVDRSRTIVAVFFFITGLHVTICRKTSITKNEKLLTAVCINSDNVGRLWQTSAVPAFRKRERSEVW